MPKTARSQPQKEKEQLIATYKNGQRVNLIRHFYQARALFKSLYTEYERSGQLSFTDLDNLIEEQLRPIKDISHSLFKESQVSEYNLILQRTFDMMFGIMFHVLLKAKENLRLQENYDLRKIEKDAEHIRNNSTQHRTSKQLIDSLQYLKREYITQRTELDEEIRNAYFIFDHTASVFEAILHVYRDNTSVLRSLYFESDFFNKVCPEKGFDYILEYVYRRGGALTGYCFLACDFLHSGHETEALDAIRRGLEYGRKKKVSPGDMLNVFLRAKRALLKRPKQSAHHTKYIGETVKKLEKTLRKEIDLRNRDVSLS